MHEISQEVDLKLVAKKLDWLGWCDGCHGVTVSRRGHGSGHFSTLLERVGRVFGKVSVSLAPISTGGYAGDFRGKKNA